MEEESEKGFESNKAECVFISFLLSFVFLHLHGKHFARSLVELDFWMHIVFVYFGWSFRSILFANNFFFNAFTLSARLLYEMLLLMALLKYYFVVAYRSQELLRKLNSLDLVQKGGIDQSQICRRLLPLQVRYTFFITLPISCVVDQNVRAKWVPQSSLKLIFINWRYVNKN